MTTWAHTFTGTNGAAWDTTTVWTLVLVGTGAGTIQTNRGRLATRNVAYGAGANAFWKEVTASVNGEFTGTTLTDGTKNEQYGTFGMGDATAGFAGSYPSTGYFVEYDESAGTAQLRRGVSGSYTLLGSAVTVQSGGLTNSTTYSYRFRRTLVSGNIQIDWKMWTGTEPGPWSQSYTDSSSPWTGTGKPCLTTQNGNSTTVRYFDNDTLGFDDLASGYSANAALSGSGTLTATVVPAIATSASLSGSGTLTAAVVPASATTASLSGGGTLTATLLPKTATTATLSGSGTLSAVASAPALTRAVALSGAGTLTATTSLTTATTAALTGSGSLTAGRTVQTATTASLSGSGALTAAVLPKTATIVGLSGSGTLTATASAPAATATAALGGTGTLTASSATNPETTAYLSGAGTLTATVVPRVTATVGLGGGGTLTVIGSAAFTSAPILSGGGTLTATASTPSVGALAVLSGGGSLTVSTVLTVSGVVNLSGSGTLTVVGTTQAARDLTLTAYPLPTRFTTPSLDDRFAVVPLPARFRVLEDQ
jgi:hypothetical protein